MKLWTTLFALPLLAASCSENPEPAPQPEAGTIRVTVGSGPRIDISADTRTALGDDGVTVRWTDGDEIALWGLDAGGGERFSAAPFALWHYNASFGEARFRGDIPQLEAGEYTYLAVPPRPAAVEGARPADEIPAVPRGGARCHAYLLTGAFPPPILERAGPRRYRTVQPIDGRSFVPLLTGRGANPAH